MERQELIKKIEQLPPDRLAEVERFVESISNGEQYPRSLKEIVEEVLEEAAFAKAIDEGCDTPRVTREEIFHILESAQ
jgi:hypothetical protein